MEGGRHATIHIVVGRATLHDSRMKPQAPVVVIVAYRNTDDLATALASIGPGHRLVVVDNDGDPQVERIVDAYGGVYLAPGRNVGFAAAVNLALAKREGRDVLLLNPDARGSVSLPEALAAVLHGDRRIAAVAPKLVHSDGSPQPVAWPIPSPREAWIDALKLRRFFAPRSTFLTGAALLLRSEALDDVGGFDERFFLYAEETDWQLRALQLGWTLEIAQDVVVEHEGGASSDVEPARNRSFNQSAELFARKWYGNAGWASMRAAFVVGTSARLLLSLHRPAARARYARTLRGQRAL
jgi:GT2 family glycosyltransferase